MFDEQIKKKNQMVAELFTESYQKLAEVVTGENSAPHFSGSLLLNRRVVMDIAKQLDVDVPYSSNEDYSIEYYLDEVFRPQGIMWREVRLGEKWYTDAMGVMLGSLEDGRSIALIPHGLSGYVYRDPDTGERTRVTLRNAKKILREAKVFYRPLPQRELSVRDILFYMRKCSSAGDVALYVIATVAVILLGMVTPAMTKLLFSIVVSTGNSRLLLGIFILLIVTAVTKLIFSIINQLVLPRISSRRSRHTSWIAVQVCPGPAEHVPLVHADSAVLPDQLLPDVPLFSGACVCRAGCDRGDIDPEYRGDEKDL